MTEDAKAALRAEITHLLRRVPASVNSGSAQRAQAYHKAASMGLRVAGNERSTLHTLQHAASELRKFEACQ